MTLKEMIVNLSGKLSVLSADSMMKVSLHFAHTSEEHWYTVLNSCEPDSQEHREAGANWQRVRMLQIKIKEAQRFQGHFHASPAATREAA